MGDTTTALDPENAAFWLPTHFLTDDDFLSDDYPLSSTETEIGDTHTHKNFDNDNNINNDDDDFLAELTRHLAHSTLSDEKPWMFSTSPQSTLSGFGPWTNRSGFSSNGSPNGPSSRVPSPPLTPPPPPPSKNDAAWELLYEAAGQVARLKMKALAAQVHHHNHHNNHHNNHQQNRGLLSAPRNVSLPLKPHHRHVSSFYDLPHSTQEFQLEQAKRQGNGNYYCQHNHHNQQQRRSCGGAPLGLPQSAWPPLRPNHHRQPNGGPAMRAVFLNGPGSGSLPGVRKQSTGTGVFLPRRVGTTTTTNHHQPLPELRKKPTGCSTVLLPARVVQALNLDLDEINNGVNANSQSRFGSGLFTDHDMLMARRNAILEQQRRNLIRNEGTATMVGHGHDIRLPNDWTY